MKKIILSTIASILVYTIAGWLVETISVQFNVTTVYLRDFLFYLVTPVLAISLAVYFFRTQRKYFTTGFIVGFVVYYSFFWLAHLWGMGEALECTDFFFNLMSNCPQ